MSRPMYMCVRPAGFPSTLPSNQSRAAALGPLWWHEIEGEQHGLCLVLAPIAQPVEYLATDHDLAPGRRLLGGTGQARFDEAIEAELHAKGVALHKPGIS